MASLDVIKRLTFRAQAEGFEDTARKFESLGKAEEGLIASSERIEKSSGRVESSFRRIQGSLDPAAKATQQFESTLKGIRAAQEQGITTQARGNELIELAEKRAIAAATATERFAEAHKGLSAQSQAALHSIRSVAEQVALGISPIQALTGQMNHLSFAATGEGGLKGAFAGLGPVLSGALRFVNPLTIGLAAVGGAALAANRALDQQHEARVATTSGLGRFGQATAADVGAIANRAAGNGVSIGQAREAVLAFTRAGVESNDVIERGTKIVQRYAATFGGEFADAQKELAGLAAEPGKAIDAVAKRAGIDVDITNHIKLLDSLGDKTRAANEAFDALDKALVRDADASTAAGRAKAFLFSQATKVADFVGGIATGQPRDTAAAQRAAQQALATGTNLRPGFEGEPIRGVPGVSPEAGIDEMQATATAKALDEVSRATKRRELIQKGVNEEIRKSTEAHQLDLAAIHAHTAEEQAGVATTRTFLELQGKEVNDEVARAAATEAGEKVLAAHNQQQEDAVRIGKANVAVIQALGGEQLKAATYAQALAVKTDDFAGAQAKVNDITAQQAVAERNRTLQHQANMAAITAVTQAQAEAAAGQQAYTAALIGGATAAQASTAASQAMAEEQAKDAAAAHQIRRAHEANMLAIVALTTEEKANAAASVAAAGQRQGSMAAAAAATAAYAEEVAKAAVTQRDFDRQLAASQGNAKREAQAGLQAAQLPIGPGRQRQAGQIEATAAAQSQVATIQAQNPNIQIDTSAFVKAAQDVAALGEAARQSNTSLQLIAGWQTQAANLATSTAVLTGNIDAAAAASQQVVNSGMAQINLQGLEGDARQQAINALNGLSQATFDNVAAQQSARDKSKEDAHNEAARQDQLARGTNGFADGLDGAAVGLKNLERAIQNTTVSAEQASGKLLGAAVTLTGLITPTTALRLNQLHGSEARLAAFQRSQGANDNSAAMAIASPVASLVDNAQSQLESARDQVKSAEDSVKSAQESVKNSQAQAMANATKSDPQLDPYLSRNASVYYGTATEAFYKEISWQEASLNAANASLSNEQEALATAQQELATAQAAYSTAQAQFGQLQSIAASANSMAAAGMSPTTIGTAVASALAGAGYAKSAQDVTTATQSYTTQAMQAALTQKVEQQKASLAGTPYYPSVTSASFNTTPSPFTGLKDLPRFAEGGVLGAGQWGIAGESGPELIRGPAQVVPQKGAEGVTVNDYRVTHVYGVTAPENVAARLESDAKDRAGYSGAAMRAARLAA